MGAVNGQSDPVITPVTIQGSMNIPLILKQLQKEKLALSIELLGVQIHRVLDLQPSSINHTAIVSGLSLSSGIRFLPDS
jgi:hypothetical protein